VIYGVREYKVTLSDTQLDCISFGKGEKPLIMIQGLNTRGIKGAGLPLAWMYRLFVKDYRVYLFDRRPKIRDGVTVRELAKDTAEAMDVLGLKKADVFGVSEGGMIGQYLAIDRPDLVGRLVLAATLSRNNDTVLRTVNGWIEMAEQGDMAALVADMTTKMYSEAYVKRYKPLIPLLTVLQKPKDVQRFVRLARSCLTCNAYEELEKIHCPVFVIGGKRDRVVSGEASEELAEKLGCGIFMYDRLGHAAYEEAKDFNRKVYDFLRGEPPSTGTT